MVAVARCTSSDGMMQAARLAHDGILRSYVSRAPPARPLEGNHGQDELITDDLADMLSLIEGADSVELKLTVPESSQRSILRALDLDPLDAQIRQVFFFDTPDLALDKAGVVARARRMQGKGDDSVVELGRPRRSLR